MASTLDGITVLDLGSGMAAALATMFMSDHGARVIRVIDKDDEALRDGGFIIWDRGKECIALDLSAAAKDPDAAAEYRKLIAGADVVLEDFAPTSDRQNLVDSTWLKRINPRLIACSVTAYGKSGPLKDEPPIDDLVLARMGALGGMPGFRPAPVHVAHELPSVGAAIFANLGVAAALLGRETTGRGRSVETSLMAGALLFHPKVVGENVPPNVFQTDPTGSAPFYSLYECADGEWIQLGCVHVGFMAIAAKLMGIGDLVAEPRFEGGRGGKPEDEAELRATLRDVMKKRPSAEWAKAFEDADVPFAQCRQTEDGMADPQIEHNEMLVTLDDPALGPVMQMGVPIKFSETPGEVRGPRAAAASTSAPDNYPSPLD
ncbi:MAG: CoA transferase, partial [Alphaproteobacteria bacterium]|nr:CoA transferase [Alphaproteobacteria bacterium]